MSKLIRAALLLSMAFVSACSERPVTAAVNNLDSASGIGGFDLAGLVFEHVQRFPEHTELAIALVHDTSVQYYGLRRVADSFVVVINNDQIFEAGSITKVFTATLLAAFVQEGKINLHDPINNALPFTLNKDLQLTYLQLANHTSGLPRLPSGMLRAMISNPDDPYRYYTDERLKEYLMRKLKADKTPGTTYAYSNLGAGLLAYTMRQQTGRSFEEMLQQKIFEPYGMYSSTVHVDQVPKDRLVPGRDGDGGVVPNWNLAALEGGGALLSSVTDLARFLQAQMDTSNVVLAMTRKSTFDISERMAIGLGWHILKRDEGPYWYWHNGGTAGYTSSMAVEPTQRNAVVILSNVSALHNKEMKKIDELCFALMKQLGDHP